MKPTKPFLKTILLASLIICSFSCFVFMSSLENKQALNDKKMIPNQQVDEVAFPDVFEIKNLVTKIVQYLPAS